MRQTAANLRKLFITYPILAHVHRERHEFQQAIRALCERAISERNRDLHANLLPLITGPEQDYYSAILRFGCLPAELDQLDVSTVLRPRFTLSRGITRWKQGDMDGARGLIKEASALATKMNDAFVFVDASIARAILLGNESRHNTALELVDVVLPIAQQLASFHRAAVPILYNTAAVELLAINKLEGAARYSSLALLSPLKMQYTGWIETAAEIAERSVPPKQLYFSVRTPDTVSRIAETARTEVDEIEPPGALPGVYFSMVRYRAIKEANSGRVPMDKLTNTLNKAEARRQERAQIDEMVMTLHDQISKLAYKKNSLPAFRAASTVLNVADMTEEESTEIIIHTNALRKPKVIKGNSE